VSGRSPNLHTPAEKSARSFTDASIYHLCSSTEAVVHTMSKYVPRCEQPDDQVQRATLTRGFRVLKGSARVTL
jgi:hypothetical protein